MLPMIIFKTSRWCRIILTTCLIKEELIPTPPSTTTIDEQANKKMNKQSSMKKSKMETKWISSRHNRHLTIPPRIQMMRGVSQQWRWVSNKISSNSNKWPTSKAKISTPKNYLHQWWTPKYNRENNQIMLKIAIVVSIWCRRITMLKD